MGRDDIDGAPGWAATRVEASCHIPHLAQAPMEPPRATAGVTGDGCEVSR